MVWCSVGWSGTASLPATPPNTCPHLWTDVTRGQSDLRNHLQRCSVLGEESTLGPALPESWTVGRASANASKVRFDRVIAGMRKTRYLREGGYNVGRTESVSLIHCMSLSAATQKVRLHPPTPPENTLTSRRRLSSVSSICGDGGGNDCCCGGAPSLAKLAASVARRALPRAEIFVVGGGGAYDFFTDTIGCC